MRKKRVPRSVRITISSANQPGTWLASQFRAMTDNDARREALSVWMLEFSVLWAVFPVLDQIVEHQPIDVWITFLSVAISLTTLAIGVMLKRGERT